MALAKACSFSFVPMYILYLLLQNLQSMNIIEKAFLQSCNSHFLKSLYKMCTYKLQLVIVCQKKNGLANQSRTISAGIFNVRHIIASKILS